MPTKLIMTTRVIEWYEMSQIGLHVLNSFTVVSYVNALFFIWTTFCVASVSAEDCVKISDCAFTCSGYTYDISSIGLTDGHPRFEKTVGAYVYAYNPCFSFAEGGQSSDCAKVASCQITALLPKLYYDCGIQSSVKFQKLPGKDISSLIQPPDKVYLVATYTAGDFARTTKVAFFCDASDSFTVAGEEPGSSPPLYVYQMGTPNACESQIEVGIGVGSVLIIIFLVVCLLYFFGGIVYMKVRRGAMGSELVPNRTFWASLPWLIKDGVWFVARGCKPGSNYAKL